MKKEIYTNSPEELEREQRKLRMRIVILAVLIVLCVVLIILLAAYGIKKDEGGEISIKSTLVKVDYEEDKAIYEAASAALLRLHIIGNSNSVEDQRVKLLVRNAVICYISENIGAPSTKQEAVGLLRSKLDAIKLVADNTLREAGFTYSAGVNVSRRHFPGKVYDGFYLPAGDYDALCITLGEGGGRNWWCIAYPALCLYGNAEYEDGPGRERGMNMLSLVLPGRQCRKMKTERVKISFRCRWLRDYLK